MVALLARYHRRYNPEPNHPHFSDLTREERMIVLKLAALLRLADSLDRSHAQRIKSIQLRPEGSRLIMLTQGADDTTVEQIAIDSKCDLFREIYGYDRCGCGAMFSARPLPASPMPRMRRRQVITVIRRRR
jgi:exopolyphosphatase/guanosine-5'-triphosphate,3'-diphosphate pyrophosphatase